MADVSEAMRYSARCLFETSVFEVLDAQYIYIVEISPKSIYSLYVFVREEAAPWIEGE